MEDLNVERILFIDIETVPLESDFSALSEPMQELWNDKFDKFQQRQPGRFDEAMSAGEGFSLSAGLFAEFGRVVCVSVGVIRHAEGGTFLHVKSYADSDERVLLKGFSDMLEKACSKMGCLLCGHNIKEFDVPFLCRRYLVNGMPIPALLNVSNLKPWEMPLFDTLEMWRFGDFKHYSSLKLLTTILGIPSPKDDIDGSEVAQVYYKEHDLKRISTYCEKDVVATTQLFLRLSGLALIDSHCVKHL